MDDDFYAAPGPLTDLREQAAQLRGLPRDPPLLRAMVAEWLRHIAWNPAYELPPANSGPEADPDCNLRSAGRILDRVLQLAPLDADRVPSQRVTATCRSFAVLYAALLRSQGVPARVRCGFASYFTAAAGGLWADHWITEYRHGRHWRRADPQLDDVQLPHVTVDPDDVTTGFLTASEAWTACRQGKADPALFGVAQATGTWFIAASVVRDMAALNKFEPLPWDYWGPLAVWDGNDQAVDHNLIDRLCATPVEARTVWAQHLHLLLPPAQASR